MYAVFFLYMAFLSLFRQKKRWKTLPAAPDGLEAVVFETGLYGFWNKGAAGNRLALVFVMSFPERQAHLGVLRDLFVGYDVLFLDLPATSQEIVSDAIDACRSLARFRAWERVGFIGVEEGCFLQSAVAAGLQRLAIGFQPAWIVQFNGFTSLVSSRAFRGSVWPPDKKAARLDSRVHLPMLSCPIVLFHNKASTSSPLTESVCLHRCLATRSSLVVLFGHDEYFLFSKENKAIITGALSELLRE
ncbi:hypothetical protein EBZ80_06635 [bacterium]|nr:hypothetical protein [bacterium]